MNVIDGKESGFVLKVVGSFLGKSECTAFPL